MYAERLDRSTTAPSSTPPHRHLLRRTVTAVGVAGVAVALLAGCGSSSGTDSSSSTSSAAAAPSSGSGTSSSAATITIKDYKYAVPSSVKPGQKIMVKNEDSEAHTVTTDSGSDFNDNAAAGSTTSFTAPSKAGSYKFHCTFHSNMHGTLVVK